jgi:hypothetical protein
MATPIKITEQDTRVDYKVTATPDDTFNIPFEFFETSDIRVSVGGVEQTSGFTVTGTSVQGGFSDGTLTLDSAVSNTTVSIWRDIPLSRTSVFPTSGEFSITSLNTQLARIVAMIQQEAQTFLRALRLPESESGKTNVLPARSDRADRVLAFDSDGQPVGRAVADLDTSFDTALDALADGDELWFDKSAGLWRNKPASVLLNGLQSIDVTNLSTGAVRRLCGRTSDNDGGQGVFVWDGSDLSTEVGNDEVTAGEGDGGIYVAPSSDKTGASGAWVRAVEDHVDARWYGIDASGEVTAALKAALNAAAGKRLVFVTSGTYSFTETLTVQDKTYIQNTGRCVFEADIDLSSSNATAISVGNDCGSDYIKVTVPSGRQIQRLTVFGDRNHHHHVEADAVDQQTSSDDNVDSAVKIEGVNSWYGFVKVNNFDVACKILGADNSVIEYLDVTSYIRGIALDTTDGFWLHGGYVRTAAPDAATTPGHNGFLTGNSTNWHIYNLTVERAGEHAFRIGSDFATNWSWVNCHAIEPGQCGFKVAPSGTGIASDGRIIGCTARDGSYNNSPGSNEDGLRLQACEHTQVVGFMSYSSGSKTHKFYDGVFMENCFNVKFSGLSISDTANYGIHITDTNGACNQISFDSPTIIGTALDGIKIDHTTENLRDIIVTRCWIRDYTNYAIDVQGGDAGQPSIFDGFAKDESTGVFNKNMGSATAQDRIYGFMNAVTN